MGHKQGRRMDASPDEIEAAGQWARGEVQPETEPTPALIGGLVLASGLLAGECCQAWGINVATLARWRQGVVPTRLTWWGLVAWWRGRDR